MEKIRIKSADADFSYWPDAGRLRAEGKLRLRGKLKYSFAFDSINCDPIVTERRQSFFQTGVSFFLLGAFLLYLVFLVATGTNRMVVGTIALAITAAGAGMALLFLKPVEILTFTNETGAGLFNVIKTKANAVQVEELFELIRSNKSSRVTPAPAAEGA